MAFFDWIVLVLIAVSMTLGLWRGFVYEVIGLAGWIAAFVGAQWFAGSLAPWLPIGEPDAPWRYAAAFILLFIAIAFLGGLIAALTRKLVTVVGLRPVDRTLGGLFGAARALVALLAFAVVVHLLALGTQAWWQASVSAPWLDTALQGLKPALPQKLASYLP